MGDHIIIDNFLNDFKSFRNDCDEVNYEGVKSPVDGIFYPGVSTEISKQISSEITEKVSNIFKVNIQPNYMFLRLSTEGIEAPHQAHTDSTMGDYSLMLYLNRLEDCIGGTSFLVHKKTGLFENPANNKQQKVWEEDVNNPDAWQILDICSMVPNRACIFESKKIHRSEPIGGFGNTAKNGRLFLVFFFSL